MECYSALKSDEVKKKKSGEAVIHATIWINPEIKRKKPVTEDHVLWDVIYMKCPEQADLETESRWVVARACRGAGNEE